MKQFLLLVYFFLFATHLHSQSILDLYPKYFASFGGIHAENIERINKWESAFLNYEQDKFELYKDSINNPEGIINVKIQFTKELDLQKAFNDLKMFPNLYYLELSNTKLLSKPVQIDMPEDFSGIKGVELLHLWGDLGWDFIELSNKLGEFQSLKHLAINSLAKDKFSQLELGKLRDLKGLYLSGREGTTFPHDIEKLVHLEGLIISADQYPDFKEQVLKLQKLPSLKEMKLLYMTLENGDQEAFENFKTLERLELTNVKVKDLEKFFAAFPSENVLKHLEIFGSESAKFTEGITRFRSLEHLKLERLGDSINFPEDIFDLKDLKFLMLSDNDNFTSLSPKIENLKELEELTLYFNSLEHLPDELGNLENLQYLNLKHNNLEKLPENLGNLSSLKKLIANTNQLESLPPGIGQLKNLRELDVETNRLTTLPESFSGLSNLKVLNINANDLQHLPAEFGKLVKLEKFQGDQNLLQELPSSFSDLEALEVLSLRNNNLSSLPSFKKLKALSEFIINNHPAYTNISNYDASRNRAVVDSSRVPRRSNNISHLPPNFADLERLELIDISENPLETEALWQEIKEFKSSKYSLKAENTGINFLPEEGWKNILAGSLYLRNNQINSVPADIINAPYLSILDISRNPFFLSGNYENKEKLAVVMFEAGQLPEEMLKKNFRTAKAYLDLSYQKNSRSTTLEYMNRAFEIDSVYASRNIRRTKYAEALLEAGEYEHAIEQFTKEIQQDTAARVRILNFTVPLFENRAKAFLAMGDTIAAINDLRIVSQKFNSGNWGEAGLLARKINEDSLATDLFNSGLEAYERQIAWNDENNQINYGYQLSKLELLIIAEEFKRAKDYHSKLFQEEVNPLRNEVLLEYFDLILKAISKDLSKIDIQQFTQKISDEEIKITGWSFDLFQSWLYQTELPAEIVSKMEDLTIILKD